MPDPHSPLVTSDAISRTPVQLDRAERSLCRRLTGASEPLSAALIAAARRHRVHLLVAASLTSAERSAHGEAASLVSDLRAAAALDAAHQLELTQTLDALAAGGVDALILKGTGLAYTIYGAPHLRPRADVDLLIREPMLDRAACVVGALGWVPSVQRDATLSSSQRQYVKTGRTGGPLALDVHWRIANPLVFAGARSFDELRPAALPVAPLGPAARTLSRPDALLLACMHRVAHHDDALDLLWLWDIHLLVERLSDAERDDFVGLARAAAMSAVCRRGLELCAALFQTPAAELASRLDPGVPTREPSAQFLGGLTLVGVLEADLAALSSWRARLRVLAEHLFPSVDYMRSRYPLWPDILLPLAYAHRIAFGAPKWFRRGPR